MNDGRGGSARGKPLGSGTKLPGSDRCWYRHGLWTIRMRSLRTRDVMWVSVAAQVRQDGGFPHALTA